MELQTADVTLHYTSDGDPDAPPVLLLHGITQSTATWAFLVPLLADGHRVVRLDFRGHGQSGRTPGAYDFAGYVRDAQAICEDVLGSPAVLVGHSLGGGTAAALAQQQPALVRSVVLEDPPLLVPPTGVDAAVLSPDNTLLAGFRMMRESIPRLQESGLSAGDVAELLRAAPSPSGPDFGTLVHDDALAAMAEAMLQLDASVLDPVLEGTSRPIFDPFSTIPVPGIVVAADAALPDALVRAEDIRRLHEHSPHIDVRVATGSGHLVHDSREHRSVVETAVTDLLRRP